MARRAPRAAPPARAAAPRAAARRAAFRIRQTAAKSSQLDDGEHASILEALFGGAVGPVELLSALDRTIDQFRDLKVVADRRLVARCLYAKAETLAKEGRHGDAVAACAELERRADRDEDPVVQNWLGRALAGMAASLVQLWLPERAREVVQRAADRFKDATDPNLRAFGARALSDECILLRDLGDTDASVAAAHEAFRIFGRDPDAGVRAWACAALNVAANTELKAERFDEAARDYELLYTTYRDDSDTRRRELGAAASFERAVLLERQGRSGDAIARYDELAARGDDRAIDEVVVKALLNLAVLTGAQGRAEDEIAIYDRIDARFGSARSAPIAGWAAAALRNKALTLVDMHRGGEAHRVLQTLLERYRSVGDPAAQEQVSAAERDLAALRAV